MVKQRAQRKDRVSPQCTCAVHTAGVRRKESDQKGAMPPEQRNDACPGGTGRYGGKLKWGKCLLGQRWRRGGEVRRLCRDVPRCYSGRAGNWRALNTTLLTATIATAAGDRLVDKVRRNGPHCLHRNEQEAENYGGGGAHNSTLRSHRRGAMSYLGCFFSAASIFAIYLALSFLKSFRQDLQHNLISRPSSTNT